jgi:hypothetical protein
MENPHLGGETDLQDSAWVSQLSHSRSGRLLQAHLASVEDIIVTEGRNGSVQACVENRKSFLYALIQSVRSGQSNPCNLPKKLPKFIAVVNLSGENTILYSDRDTLMRKLCSRSTVTHPQTLRNQLMEFSKWVNTKQCSDVEEAFVLIVFQLPWQAGIGCMHWEVNNVLVTHGKGAARANLVDREMTLSSLTTGIFKAKPSLRDLESMPCCDGRHVELLNPRQVAAFRDHYTSANLDFEVETPTDATAAAASNAAAPRPAAEVGELLRAVMKQRQAMMTELQQVKDELKEEKRKAEAAARAHEATLEARLATAAAEAGEALKLMTGAHDEKAAELAGMQPKMATLVQEQAESKKQHERLSKLYEKFKGQIDAQNKLANAAHQKLTREKAELEEKMAALISSHKQATGDLTKAHQRDMERAVSDEKKRSAALRVKVTSSERLMNQLAENNDRKDAELAVTRAELSEASGKLTALAVETKEQRDEINALKMELAVVDSSVGKLTSEIKTAKERHAKELEVLQTSLRENEDNAASLCDALAQSSHTRSVACETDTVGTMTHQCAVTQTDQARVLPEDVPASIQLLSKVDDKLVSVSGTFATNEEDDTPKPLVQPTEDEELAVTGTTTDAQLSSPPLYREPIDMPPSFHAMTALTAVQWLVQWTHSCESMMQQQQQQHFQYDPNQQYYHQASPQYMFHGPPSMRGRGRGRGGF